jgi:hypothetical protein
MKLFRWLGSLFDDADTAYSSPGTCESIFLMDDDVSHPANGVPMIGDFGGIDIEGNLYGTDSFCDSSWDSTDQGGCMSGGGEDW